MDMRTVLLAFLISGCVGCCTGDQYPIPGQERAVDIIWHHWFAEKRDPTSDLLASRPLRRAERHLRTAAGLLL
jgi:hypothetical protein